MENTGRTRHFPVRHNLDEFDGSDNEYLNAQYKLFRRRLVELYHNMGRILNMEDQEGQYRSLLTTFVQIEAADNRFIKNTLNAVAEQKIQEMEIASLLLVNRLFTQSCRMQIYSMKDLLLSQEQVNNFDRAMDVKEIIDTEKKEIRTEGEQKVLKIDTIRTSPSDFIRVTHPSHLPDRIFSNLRPCFFCKVRCGISFGIEIRIHN